MYRRLEAPAKNVIFYSKLSVRKGEKGSLGKHGKIAFGDLLHYHTYEGPRTMIHSPIVHWKLGHFSTSADGTIRMYKISEVPALIKDIVGYRRRMRHSQ